MDTQKRAKLVEYVRETAAEYLAREANRDSLITVTGVDLSETEGAARIRISVLPQEKEESALAFVSRRANDYRLFFMEKIRMNRPPKFTFAIDLGEKTRQKLDEIAKKS